MVGLYGGMQGRLRRTRRLLITAVVAAGALVSVLGSSTATQAAAAQPSINGRIAFDSSRPPAPNGLRLIWSVAADGSDL